MYDLGRGTFLAAEPNICLVRHCTPPDWLSAGPPTPSAKISLLAAIPEGSGLAVESELQSLRRAVRGVNNLEVTDLTGRVTPIRLQQRLTDKCPDILHFVGHGELDIDGCARIRLNSEDGGQEEFWADEGQIALVFQRPVTFALFNCCYGGRSERSTLSGLGPLLMKKGVQSVVAMNYPIADEIARRFSEAFYTALLTGLNPGRVDSAIQQARNSLYINATTDRWRSFITPVLYLAKGHEKLFEFDAESTRGLVTERPSTAESLQDVILPDELKNQFKSKRCVPVIGTGIFGMPRDRREAIPSTLRALTEHLGNQCTQRDARLQELAEHPGYGEIAFQAVAEIFVTEKRRFNLIEVLRSWHENAKPSPAHLDIALWPVPAVFYTHFDGILEAAFQLQGRTPKIAFSLSDPPDLQLGPVLLLVRGTLSNEASLVLTEQDHEQLASVIDRLSPAIEQLTTAVLGRSVVFIGVNPRDPIVRKLARRLVRPGGNQGPAFFVGSHFTAADTAYWRGLDVIWVEADPAATIKTLTDLLKD
jgi:hypothetical protein